MTAVDALGGLTDGGPIQPLNSYEVATLICRADPAIPEDAIAPHRFNGLNVITFAPLHYGAAKQLADALGMYELRPTDIRTKRWEIPTEVTLNGTTKPAVLRVEYVDTKAWPTSVSCWDKEGNVA